MKNKNKTQIIIFLLILLLLNSSFYSIGFCTNVNQILNNENNNISSCSSIRVKSLCLSDFNSINMNEQELIKNPVISSFDDINNIPITNSLANESYPSLVLKGIEGLVAYQYVEGTKPYIYLKNTKDFGQNWSVAYKLKSIIYGIERSVNSPSVCINPNTGVAYGAFLSEYNNSGIHGIFNVPDIGGDLNDIYATGWDWSNINGYRFWGFKDITINYHNNNIAPWITSYIGSTNYKDENGVGPCNNAVMYGYLGPDDPNEMWIQWEPGYENCSNLSVAMSSDSKKIYGVSEKKNGSKNDLLYFSGSYIITSNGPILDLDYNNITTSGNFYHPKIYLYGNKIYIAVENNLNEIILYVSIDNGKNWILYNLTSDILPPNSNPKFASLFAYETTLYVTFIESGNILVTSSPIGAINWTKSVQLNDFNGSVVSKYRYSYMFDINHIVWTDLRNGNYDLYSYIRNIPVFDLKVKNDIYLTNLGYTFMQTKNMINFTIVNLGGFEVEDIDIKITYQCINKSSPMETEYPAFISYLDSYGEKSFNQYLFRMTAIEFIKALISFVGIQNITVTVDPDNEHGDKNLNDNSVTIQVIYKDIFPLISSFFQTKFLK